MLYGAAQALCQAVLTHRSVPKKSSSGAKQPEIVEGLDHRDLPGPGGIVHCRRNEHQGIVNMHNIDVLLFDDPPDLPIGPGIVEEGQGQCQLLKPGKAFQLRIMAGIEHHMVPMASQQLRLGGYHRVLPPGELIIIVDKQYVHVTSPAAAPEEDTPYWCADTGQAAVLGLA